MMNNRYSLIIILWLVLILFIHTTIKAQINTFTHDFEKGNLDGWNRHGTAFDNQPTLNDNSVARHKGSSNLQGEWWIGTFENYQGKPDQKPGDTQGDKPMGRLNSKNFVIPRGTLSFLIGGGKSPNLRVELVEILGPGEFESAVRFSATGNNSETMRRVSWNLDALAGKTGYINIVDAASGAWGHINVDDFKFTPPVEQVTVPHLYGKKLEDAFAALKINNLIPGTITPANSPKPNDTVIDQKPAGGIKVPPQTKVDIVVSQAKIIVPDLIGKTKADAISQLVALNLHFHFAGSVQSESDSGRVARQDPIAGNKINKGDVVSVYITVPKLELVPILIGHSIEEAREILLGNHLKLGSITSNQLNNGSGKIIAQNPSAGTRIRRWDSVSITTAMGPEKVKVPDLTGLSKNKAEGILEEKRLIIGNLIFMDRDADPGSVVSQDPPPDNEVNIGTAVNLFIQETKYKVLFITVSTSVDSGQAVIFNAEIVPQVDTVEYQFHYGDGNMSDPTNHPRSNYTYTRTGKFSAYVTATINHRIFVKSEEVYISVMPAVNPAEEPPLLLILIISGMVLLGGSVLVASKYIKNKKTTQLLKKSVKQYKGTISNNIDLKNINIPFSIKLRIAADNEWSSYIKFK